LSIWDLARSMAMLGGWFWLRMWSLVLAIADRVDRSATQICCSAQFRVFAVFRLMRSETSWARVSRLCAHVLGKGLDGVVAKFC
jgi:hypothetical protein